MMRIEQPIDPISVTLFLISPVSADLVLEKPAGGVVILFTEAEEDALKLKEVLDGSVVEEILFNIDTEHDPTLVGAQCVIIRKGQEPGAHEVIVIAEDVFYRNDEQLAKYLGSLERGPFAVVTGYQGAEVESIRTMLPPVWHGHLKTHRVGSAQFLEIIRFFAGKTPPEEKTH